MDGILAQEMFAAFQRAPPLTGYVFIDVLGNGKSAAVFRATAPSGSSRAIKVYDPELAARYGAAVQEGRQQRELTLANHTCPNLVQIYGGGKLATNKGEATYLEMEYVEGFDLSAKIAPRAFDDAAIRKALRELCVAADYLHQRGLCHRDIKTDNIRLRPNGHLVLLDLGVLRPLGRSDLTDTPTNRYFVGTLRYAPPELLHRREDAEDTNAWRAIDVYQIGTVLYELIQGAKLFAHVPDDPYADLVIAVDEHRPSLVRSDIGEDLIRLSRNALEKEPASRLRAAPWQSLLATANAPPVVAPSSIWKASFGK